MVQKKVKSTNEEPEQKKFEIPSEKEHLFFVVDVDEEMSNDPDIVFVKLEVVGGDEEGRTMLCRLCLDSEFKGFFATRLFLKACDCEYKGEELAIDTDEWIGRQFYATVTHAKVGEKTYANIGEYNFEKKIEQTVIEREVSDEVAWDSDN